LLRLCAVLGKGAGEKKKKIKKKTRDTGGASRTSGEKFPDPAAAGSARRGCEDAPETFPEKRRAGGWARR